MQDTVVQETELFWTKVAAIGQVAGAMATFIAVAVSLWIAFHGRKPRLRLRVRQSIVIGGVADGVRFLAFDVVNCGERPVHISSIGWRTGWLPQAPAFLRRKSAVQFSSARENYGIGREPPFEIQPGASISTFCELANLLENAQASEESLFTRAWPLFGRKKTRILGYVFTADGYCFYAKPESTLCDALAAAECAGKLAKLAAAKGN